jgi:hypothetical protein
MKRKKREPEVAAGKLAIFMGIGCLSIAVFSSLSTGRRLSAVSTGLIVLSWGVKEVAAAKKWKHESENEHYASSVKDRLESEKYEKMEKSGSMKNVFLLLTLVLLPIAALFLLVFSIMLYFRHKQ